MIRYFNLIFITLLIILSAVSSLKASIADELHYVSEKSDVFFYINFSQIMDFIKCRGIDPKEIDTMIVNESGDDTNRIIQNFGLKISDLDEFILVMNTIDLDKKVGYLIFLSFKNGKGFIPEDFKKNIVKLKSGIAYKASVDEDVVFTKTDDTFIIGPAGYVDSFLENKALKKSALSSNGESFLKKTGTHAMFFQLAVSEYFKNTMNNLMNSSAVMGRGLRENIFVQTLLSLESIDSGIEIDDNIKFQTGMYGAKIEDSERLQMICHTWIVGSSLLVSFSDLMSASAGNHAFGELTSDQKLMSWLHKAFGRFHVIQENKGVIISFEMNSSDTDLLISFIKKDLEKQKKIMAERLEREKTSKLTRAIIENNLDSVRKFIKEKFNPNGLDNDGNTPLGAASANGNVVIAGLLLEKGAGIDVPDIDKHTPLHLAVKAGHKAMVIFLLGKGASVSSKGDNEQTALHYNAIQGNADITEILLTKSADINAADIEGATPLHCAASSGSIHVAKLLVKKKADPLKLNNTEERAIDVAFKNNQSEVVEFLKTRFKQEPKSYLPEERGYEDESIFKGEESDDPVNPGDDNL